MISVIITVLFFIVYWVHINRIIDSLHWRQLGNQSWTGMGRIEKNDYGICKGSNILVTERWARCTGSQVTWSHPPGGRLPLLSATARPAVTFPAEKRHRLLAGTKLYCLVTEARACEQLAQGCYPEADRQRFEPATFRIASERSTPNRPL